MKIKVAIIITRSSIGGAQKYVLSMIQSLNSKVDFVVFTGSKGYLVDKLNKLGVQTKVIPSIDSGNFVKATLQVRKALQQCEPDIVNTHSSLASLSGRLAAYWLKIPSIYSVHGWFFAQNASWIRRTIGPIWEALFAPLTFHWITETAFDQTIGLRKRSIRRAELSTVIPNGVYKTSKQRQLELSKSATNLVFVGRISYQKDPSLALETFEALSEKYTLTIYCDGFDSKTLNEQLAKMSSRNRISIITDESDTASLLSNFDLMLVTSRYEGMPLSIIEAMSAGLPIVATDVCGLKELVIDKQNGMLARNRNSLELAQKVATISESPKLYKSMSEASIALFEQKHTLDQMSRALLSVFEQVVKSFNRSDRLK